ncbi:MAG: tetratricopeptide repeat protein [Proteobacteria bacterium]|nr:tetratricopeptide repeat protein [Pseudomonadota bacterium]
MNKILRDGRVRLLVGIIAALLLLLASGCAGKPPAALSALHMEAIRHNQRGVKAEAKGESPQALEEFYESFRINSSIENTEGIVVALVNSSRVYRQNGDVKSALAMIGKALPLITPVDPLYSDVAFEMAHVQLLTGDCDAASEWASKAVTADTGAKRGMRMNLLARILYLQGNRDKAESRAKEALSLNQEKTMLHEKANSLRLLGDIQAAAKRNTEAAVSYDLALAIDKALGKSKKIAADLCGLALLSLAQQNPDQAVKFYQRAFTVSSNGGDEPGAADVLSKISRIREKQSEKGQPKLPLAERDTVRRTLGTP